MTKTRTEIEAEFDEKFLTKSKCCSAKVRRLQSRPESGLYCDSCGRYCSEIEKSEEKKLKSHMIQTCRDILTELSKEVGGMITMEMAEYIEFGLQTTEGKIDALKQIQSLLKESMAKLQK